MYLTCRAPHYDPQADSVDSDERFMKMSLDLYRSVEQRAAMRGALSDAAHLCGAIAKEIEAANPGRGKGSVSSIGQRSAYIAKRCSDRIWAMRDKIKVPPRD
jgi:hypothetical protein